MLVLVLIPILINVPFSEGYDHGANYENVTIDTTVNVTDSKPEIINVVIQGGVASIDLTPGSNLTILCNVTIRDFNGGDTLNEVNATFYHIYNSTDTADDNNWHYTNGSCTQNRTAYGVGGYLTDYICAYEVRYYATNGTWYCNATAVDAYNFTDTEWNTTVINPLYALNVTRLIDYGDLPVENTSTNKTANITNFGNMAINITMHGYGATPEDGLAMNCTVGNITVDNQKWSIQPDDDYAAKTALVSSKIAPSELGTTISRRLDDATPVTNVTYWQLYIAPNPFGTCNGSIVFTAELP
ncbi:MAG: hypothetical protein ABIE94_07165 [archaeon]